MRVASLPLAVLALGLLVPAGQTAAEGRQGRRICEVVEEFCADPAPDLPPPADSTPSLCSDPQSCIEQLAGSTTLDQNFVNSNNGIELQVTTFVWSARSFDRMADFYMVTQYVRSRLKNVSTNRWQTFIENTLVSPSASLLLNPVVTSISPQASNCSDQVVNATTTSFSGSVGLTTTGPEVGSSTSSSWSHQTWVTCPTLLIVAGAAPRTVDWDYVLTDRTYNDEAFLMSQQWVWEIPWTALAGPDSGITFTTLAEVFTGDDTTQISQTFNMSVPAPFDVFSIPVPTLTGVSPSSVTPGTVFTITGTNLYPSGISEVFIAGNSLDPAFWFPVQDGKNEQVIVITPDIAAGQSLPIDVIIPGGVATGVEIDVTQ